MTNDNTRHCRPTRHFQRQNPDARNTRHTQLPHRRRNLSHPHQPTKQLYPMDLHYTSKCPQHNATLSDLSHRLTTARE